MESEIDDSSVEGGRVEDEEEEWITGKEREAGESTAEPVESKATAAGEGVWET